MGKTRVLVVDDEELIRELVVETLSHGDYEVRAAGTADEARAACGAGAVDVVLLDVDLGRGQSGFELCRELRAGDVPPTVVFLSGLGSNTDRLAGEAAGGSAYLTKPFSPLELLRLLGDLVG
ncbi:MAG: response regulator transcription factor [Planctomycetota bacterium]